MSILANYVRKNSLFAIMAAVVALVLLKLIFDYLSELDSLSPTYTFVDALRYIALTAPEALLNYMPVGALLGAVVGLGLLANNSELVVMQSAGLSRFNIVNWVIQPAVILVALGLLVGQFVLPTTNLLAHQVKQSNPLLSSAVNGYWDKQDNRIIAIDYADAKGELKNIHIWQFNPNGTLQSLSQADTGHYLNQSSQTDKNSRWQLDRLTVLNIGSDGRASQQTLPQQSVTLPIEPLSIYLLTRRPDDMSLTDLWQHRQFLANNHRRSLEHEVAFWKKILSPFSVLSLVLVACSFVFGSLRSQSLGFRIVMALLFGLVFSYLQDLVGFVSLSTGFSPFLMVLLPIVASGLLGIYLIKTKR